MNETIAALAWTGIAVTPWKLIGLMGAMMFGARWLLQFAASRRAGRAVVPRSFWIISLCGSAMTLSYFLFSDKQDAVGVLQNLLQERVSIANIDLIVETLVDVARNERDPAELTWSNALVLCCGRDEAEVRRRAETGHKYIGVLTVSPEGENDPELTASEERGKVLFATIAERIAETSGAAAPAQSVRTVTYTMQPMAIEVPLRGRPVTRVIMRGP